MPRLSKEEVIKIKRLLLDEETTLESLSKEFNVTMGTICAIKKERSWKDVPFDPEDPTRKPTKTVRKLSVESVIKIKKALSQNTNYQVLAEKFSMSVRAIQDIDLGRTWNNVSWPDGYVRTNKNPAKLSHEDVKEIKYFIANRDISLKSIASKYNVSVSTISKIKKGVLYPNIQSQSVVKAASSGHKQLPSSSRIPSLH